MARLLFILLPCLTTLGASTGPSSSPVPCGPKSSACCNPSSTPPQLCPGGIPCPKACGGSNACQCPSAPAPSPGPAPGPSSDTRLTVINGCQHNGPLWVAHIDAGGLGPDPQDVKLLPGASARFHTGAKGGGGLTATRFWPKMGCDATGSNCTVGSSGGPGEGCVVRVPGSPDDYSHCAPPVDTKFEATFAAWQGGSSAQKDVLDMSLVDGYSLPFKLEVSGGSCLRNGNAFTEMDCSGLSLDVCPSAEVLNNKTVSLNAIDPKTGKHGGCYSPCMKLTDDKWNSNGTSVAPDSAAAGQYCCAGSWGTPQACKTGAILGTKYLKAVKDLCPAAYGYAYDDKTATIACTTTTEYVYVWIREFYCCKMSPFCNPLYFRIH